jgi:hypothetical protein
MIKSTYDNGNLLREAVTRTAAAVVTAAIVTATVLIVLSPISFPLWLLGKAYIKIKSLLGI